MEESYKDAEDCLFRIFGALAKSKGIGITELNTAIPAYNEGYIAAFIVEAIPPIVEDMAKQFAERFAEWAAAWQPQNQTMM